MRKYPWTELTQAKWQTRRMLGDSGHGVESLVFSIADLDYNRWEGYRLGDMDRYGMVKTDKQYRILKVEMATSGCAFNLAYDYLSCASIV